MRLTWRFSWRDGLAIVALWNYLITEDEELFEWIKETGGEDIVIPMDLVESVWLCVSFIGNLINML